MAYLPSKKFIVTVSTAFIVILAGWFLVWISGKYTQTARDNKVAYRGAQTLAAHDKLSADNDSDGLKDWEETLWSTDPHNPDTDSDGTSDGDEVRVWRNPVKLASNKTAPYGDELDAITQTGGASTDKPNTLTGQLSQDFLVRYFTAKGLSGGRPLSEDQKSNIADAFAQNIENQIAAAKDQFTLSDVHVSSSKTPKTYINELGGIIDTNLGPLLTKDELQIMQSVTKSGDLSKLSELDPYIAAYNKTAASMKTQTVPPSYSTLHLEYINLVRNFQTAAEKMRMLDTDPVQSIVGLELFAKAAIRAVLFFQDLKTQVDNDGLVFAPNEPGTFFYKIFVKL